MVNELELSAHQNVINSNCINQHCNNLLLIFILYLFCSEVGHLENICGEMICTKIIINVVFNMGKLYNVEHCMNFTKLLLIMSQAQAIKTVTSSKDN